MRVEVVKKFIDRYTGDVHKVGDVLDITEKRYEEIKARGKFVKVLTEVHLDEGYLKSCTKAQLINLADDMDVDSSGTKAELIERIAGAVIYVEADE